MKNKGFTLIEVLIVVAIIATLIGTVSLSINLARPSAIDTFYSQLQGKINKSQKFSRDYNKDTKIIFQQEKPQQVIFYWHNNKKDKWIINAKIPALYFNNLSVMNNLNEILITPGGFISEDEITITNNESTLNLTTRIN